MAAKPKCTTCSKHNAGSRGLKHDLPLKPHLPPRTEFKVHQYAPAVNPVAEWINYNSISDVVGDHPEKTCFDAKIKFKREIPVDICFEMPPVCTCVPFEVKCVHASSIDENPWEYGTIIISPGHMSSLSVFTKAAVPVDTIIVFTIFSMDTCTPVPIQSIQVKIFAKQCSGYLPVDIKVEAGYFIVAIVPPEVCPSSFKAGFEICYRALACEPCEPITPPPQL